MLDKIKKSLPKFPKKMKDDTVAEYRVSKNFSFSLKSLLSGVCIVSKSRNYIHFKYRKSPKKKLKIA